MIPFNDSNVAGSRGGRVVVVVAVVEVPTGTAVMVGAVADAVVSSALPRVKGTVLVVLDGSVTLAVQADSASSTKARARIPVR